MKAFLSPSKFYGAHPLSRFLLRSFNTSKFRSQIYFQPSETTPTITYTDAVLTYCKAYITQGYNPKELDLIFREKLKLLDKFPRRTQNELPTRTMRDSFRSIVLSPEEISSPGLLRDHACNEGTQYSSTMALVDIFAASTSEAHLKIPGFEDDTSPHLIATATCASISFPLDHEGNRTRIDTRAHLRVSGHAVRTTRTTMELEGQVDQKCSASGKYRPLARCSVVTAVRKPDFTAAFVNQLIPEDSEQGLYLQQMEERFLRRQQFYREETSRAAEVEAWPLPRPNRTSKESVSIKSTLTVQEFDVRPEDRNRLYFQFGGTTLARAEKTASTAAASASKASVSLYHVGDVFYLEPVPLDTTFRCEALVARVSSSPDLLYVPVTAESRDKRSGERTLVATYHFLYKVDNDKDDQAPLILPNSACGKNRGYRTWGRGSYGSSRSRTPETAHTYDGVLLTCTEPFTCSALHMQGSVERCRISFFSVAAANKNNN